MELSKEQLNILKANHKTINLIEGYSGVGKTTILVQKYLDLVTDHYINHEDAIFIVSNDTKKTLLVNFAKTAIDRDLSSIVYTFDELLNNYIDQNKLPIFKHRIMDRGKVEIISEIIYTMKEPRTTIDFDLLINEINYIQSNICLNEKTNIQKTLDKELQVYLLTPRKSSIKGLLTFKEKQYIWKVYTKYVLKALEKDFFDDHTLYQSFLRLLYHHYDNNEIVVNHKYIFVDDIQDFTAVQLDVIYNLMDRRTDYFTWMTLDELKSIDRQRNYKNSRLYKSAMQTYQLSENFRNSKNIHNIIQSNLNNNVLMENDLKYISNKEEAYKSSLTFFYDKKPNEKIEVFFDRINLLTTNMGYNYDDILITFYDDASYDQLYDQCIKTDIPVITLEEKLLNTDKKGIVFMRKSEIVNIEFKIVMLFDADNKKICNGPINKVINISNNYYDSILFYISISNANDFLIVNTCVSEPSTLLLSAHIDYNHFVFELGSKFQIKSTLNVYRITEFVGWIKEQLVNYYHYELTDFEPHSLFDLIVNHENEKIAIKILDKNIDDEAVSKIIKEGRDYRFIVIFDNHHYIVFENKDNNFVRVMDLPIKED